jgi:curli biogenesis system outer membrane secretion channel CsgG
MTSKEALLRLARALDTAVEVQKHAYGFSVKLRYVEVKEGGVLKSVYGKGKTEAAASADAIRQYNGQILVMNAMSSDRKELLFIGR